MWFNEKNLELNMNNNYHKATKQNPHTQSSHFSTNLFNVCPEPILLSCIHNQFNWFIFMTKNRKQIFRMIFSRVERKIKTTIKKSCGLRKKILQFPVGFYEIFHISICFAIKTIILVNKFFLSFAHNSYDSTVVFASVGTSFTLSIKKYNFLFFSG